MSHFFVQQGAVGTTLQLELLDDGAVVDVSSATTKEIILEKPDGSTVTKTAAFVTDGTDGKIKYTTIAGDLDQVGRWRIQGRIISSSGNWPSEAGTFRVKANLV